MGEKQTGKYSAIPCAGYFAGTADGRCAALRRDNTMKFVFPSGEYKQRAIEYIEEFRGSAINGSGALDRYLRQEGYDAWLQHVRAQADIANVPEGFVPDFTYFYLREEDERIIGMINLRLYLNNYLRREGGHIGYSIRPSERRKGYGSRMLCEALAFFQPLIGGPVFISCDRDNPASAGVIKNCGGLLEAEFFSDSSGAVIQRYRIDDSGGSSFRPKQPAEAYREEEASFLPMTKSHAQEIAAWQYPEPYSAYNPQPQDGPGEWLNGEYFVRLDEKGHPAGFACFGESARIPAAEPDAYRDDPLDIGLGLRPNLCGKGRGAGFLLDALRFARCRFGAAHFRLSVACFNIRALRAYLRAGFLPKREIHSLSSGASFMIMEKRLMENELCPPSPKISE